MCNINYVLYTLNTKRKALMIGLNFLLPNGILYFVTNLPQEKGARWGSGRASYSKLPGSGFDHQAAPCCVHEQGTLTPKSTV